MIDEVTYCLVVRTMIIHFRHIFVKHFSPHQFDLSTHGECETMVHGV